MGSEAQFDEYAEDYEAALAQGLSVSGEGRDFFAQGRIEFLADCLKSLGPRPDQVMDFGCGTGDSVPLIRSLIGAGTICGVDQSRRSIERAARMHIGPGISFAVTDGYPAVEGEGFDVVYTNGVFHHVPPKERPSAVDFMRTVLRPGGVVSFWENNPWSPGARYVMSKIPFDRDAIMVSAAEARWLLREGGFRIIRTDYLFIFPALLRALRRLEDLVRRLPFGAQYQVLGVKI